MFASPEVVSGFELLRGAVLLLRDHLSEPVSRRPEDRMTYRIFYPSGHCFEMIGRLQSTVVEDVFTPVIVDENDVVCMLDPRAHVYCEDLPLYSPKSSGLQWVQEYLRKEP